MRKLSSDSKINFREFIRDLTVLFIDKLYWVSDAKPPQNIHNAFFFNIDNVSEPDTS